MTIADAIEICRRLSGRYLRVDALCILPDDNHDKAFSFRPRATSISVHRSLLWQPLVWTLLREFPGLRLRPGGSACAPATDSELSWSFMTTANPRLKANIHHMKETRWNTRGCICQERYLSNSCLIFTEHQVYFSCNEVVLCEES